MILPILFFSSLAIVGLWFTFRFERDQLGPHRWRAKYTSNWILFPAFIAAGFGLGNLITIYVLFYGGG